MRCKLSWQLIVLEEGDGPSIMSNEPSDAGDEESTDVKGHAPAPPPQLATPAAAMSQSSVAHTPSTEDLSSAKKKPTSRIAGSGLRAPTAGKSECFMLQSYV